MIMDADRLYIGASGVAVGTLGHSEANTRDSIFSCPSSKWRAAAGGKLTSLLVHDGAKDLFDDLMRTYASYSGVSGVQSCVDRGDG